MNTIHITHTSISKAIEIVDNLDDDDIQHISNFKGKTIYLNNDTLFITNQGIEYLTKLNSISMNPDDNNPTWNLVPFEHFRSITIEPFKLIK